MEDAFKANSLGLSLMSLVGQDVLSQAVTMLRGDITAKPKPIVQSILTLKLLQTIDFETAKQTLVDGCLFVANKMDDAHLPEKLTAHLARISALRLSDRQKALLLSAILIAEFGEATVQYVLKSQLQFEVPVKMAAGTETPDASGNVVPLVPQPQSNDPQAAGSPGA